MKAIQPDKLSVSNCSLLSQSVQALSRKVGGILLDSFQEDHWEGELSSSALSTAVAVIALRKVDENQYGRWIKSGIDWLRNHANEDGGFGDTVDCPSNLSTSLLVWSALAGKTGPVIERLEHWIVSQTGSLRPEAITSSVLNHYGRDRTFSVPILMTCALTGRLGSEPWDFVPQLPFELALLPRWLYRFAGLQVVSYALPALIAIGWGRVHKKKATLCPLYWFRRLIGPILFRKLRKIQPVHGGFLEATPLTAFVVMNLAASDNPHARSILNRGIAFLQESIREDGSWPIDTHLATWLTSLSVKALGQHTPQSHRVEKWLESQQYDKVHPFTGARPGGWAWTPLPGGVPDADDTAGALIALDVLSRGKSNSPLTYSSRFNEDLGLVRKSDYKQKDRKIPCGPLGERSLPLSGFQGRASSPRAPQPPDQRLHSVKSGIEWLIKLQNRDGGMPTFCRGWGNLPFDRSCPDITAHALRAFQTCRGQLSKRLNRRIDQAIKRGLQYLAQSQQEDGSWNPLWFGNPRVKNQKNPVYGTSRVLLALKGIDPLEFPESVEMDARGVHWLLHHSRNEDGGWGSEGAGQSTIEETALALEALAGSASVDTLSDAIESGILFLENAWNGSVKATPIGLYFASLWYSEKLYPAIFTCSALKAINGSSCVASR